MVQRGDHSQLNECKVHRSCGCKTSLYLQLSTTDCAWQWVFVLTCCVWFPLNVLLYIKHFTFSLVVIVTEVLQFVHIQFCKYKPTVELVFTAYFELWVMGRKVVYLKSTKINRSIEHASGYPKSMLFFPSPDWFRPTSCHKILR